MNISQRDLADASHVPYQRVTELVNQRRGITSSTALRLAKFFWGISGFLAQPASSMGLTQGAIV